jgi:thioredoxin:protein disulfide reductase
MMIRVLAAAATAFTLFSAPLAAEPLHPDEAFALTVTPAASGDLEVLWDVQPGYYLYGSKFAAEGINGPIPLTLPEGEFYDDPWMGEDVIFRQPVATAIPAPAGPVTLHWQGCQQDGICYAPQQARLDSDGTPLPEPARDAALPDWTSAGSGLTLAPDQGVVAGLAGRGGAALVVLGFFGFGLMLSLTPCVLPMVPIVAGMLTRQGAGLTARRGLALTGAYVTAMASAFGILGVVAAWSGANLQAALQSPLAIGLIAGVFVLLALSMFGLFQLQMPAAWQARLGAVQGARGGTLGAAAALGFGSALIVGPCVTAPLAGALIYIAQTGDVVLGAAALFALGLGQGVPLLAVGVFGPRVLPKRGAWMEGVRMAFGILFLALAIWLAGRILPGPLVLALWAVLLIGAGAILVRARMPAAAAGLVLITGGVIQGVGAALGGDDPLRPLAPLAGAPATQAQFQTVLTRSGLTQALQQDGPALIYVTADWCVICRAIERGPMAAPEVMAALEGLVRIKVDVTEFSAESQALLADLGAAGPPTMIFVNAARTEAPGSRLIGETRADAMLASARQVAQ